MVCLCPLNGGELFSKSGGTLNRKEKGEPGGGGGGKGFRGFN